jgi:hypothetical protein
MLGLLLRVYVIYEITLGACLVRIQNNPFTPVSCSYIQPFVSPAKWLNGLDSIPCLPCCHENYMHAFNNVASLNDLNSIPSFTLLSLNLFQSLCSKECHFRGNILHAICYLVVEPWSGKNCFYALWLCSQTEKYFVICTFWMQIYLYLLVEPWCIYYYYSETCE